MLTKKSFYMAAAYATLVLTTAGCMKHEMGDIRRESEQIIQEFHDNFKKTVMGDKDIDPNQTWNTAVTTRLTITVAKSGTLRIFTADPASQAAAAWLAEATVTAGSTTEFVIARPLGAPKLYAAVFNAQDNLIDVMGFDATASEVSAKFYGAEEPAAPMPPDHTFTPCPQDGDYATQLPTDIHPVSDYYLYFNKVTNYQFDDQADQQVSPQNGNAYYYCDGVRNITFGNINKDCQHIRFYILPDADIHLVGGHSYTAGGDHVFYVAAGGRLSIEGKWSSNAVIYNQGEVVIKGDISPAVGGVIYNQGTLTGEYALNIGKNGIEVINEGILSIAGNAVYNNATSYILNRGLFSVGKTFTLNLGDNAEGNGFQQTDGAGVITADFTAEGPCHLWLGARSVFRVNNKATLHFAQRDCGLYGPATGDNGPAVFHAKTVAMAKSSNTRTVPTGFMASYHRHLVVAYDESHFAQGLYTAEGADAVPYYFVGAEAVADQTTFFADTYTLPASNTSPGFAAGGYRRGDTRHYTYFAFEDLRGGDTFVYNDVVVRVATPTNGVADVELCAVGTRLEAYLFVGDTRLGGELHQEFGISVGNAKTDERTNTTASGVVTPIKKIGTVTIPQGQSVADLDLRLQVTKENGDVSVIGAPQAGTTPYRLVVSGSDDGKWFWPRDAIHKAYAKFRDWGTNATTATDWYKTSKSAVIKW